MVLSKNIPELFDDFFFNWPQQPKPPMDISRTFDENDVDGFGRSKTTGWRITLALAGFSEKDVQVWSEGHILHIKGKNSAAGIPTKFYCDFHHALKVSEHLDLDSTLVSLENGLLFITIPILEKSMPATNKLFGFE